MADLTIKAHDTYPPLVAVLRQAGLRPMDLATVTNVEFLMKNGSVLVSGTATKLTIVYPTATTVAGRSTLSSVSDFANITNGSSILGQGVPLGARVGDFDTSAQTIEMIDDAGNSLAATTSDSLVSLTINKGTVSYSWDVTDLDVPDTYNVEFELTWLGGGKQTIPNDGYASILVEQDLDNS